MRVVLFLSILFFSFSLSAERVLFGEDFQLTEDPNVAVYYQKETAIKINDAWIVELFHLETGQLAFKGSLNSANVSEGIIIGDFEFFYTSGHLASKGSKDINGNYQGKYSKYRENGILEEELYYQNNNLEGAQKKYFENGQLQVHFHMKNGTPHGLYLYYYDNGLLESRINYGADNIVDTVTFYPNGQPEDKFTKIAGYLEGEKLYWSNDGWLVRKQNYHKGKLHGVTLYYQAADLLNEISNYRHGERVGSQKYFNTKGRLKTEIVYDSKGREIQYYHLDDAGNAIIQNETHYLNNSTIVTKKEFNSAGILLSLYQSDSAKNWSLSQHFDSNGKLKYRKELINDLYEGLHIDSNWHGVQHTNYSKGKKQGAYKEDIYSGGFITGQYNSDNMVGKWVTQSEDRVRTEHFNLQGKPHGEQTEITNDGTVIYRANYKNGLLHGNYLKLDFDKRVRMQGQYVNNLREGKWLVEAEESYDMVWHGQYRNGREIGIWEGLSSNNHLLGFKQYNDLGLPIGKSYFFYENGELDRRIVFFATHSNITYYSKGEPSAEYQYAD
ncbi:toxin-antitoxin system YwqK family antitoxin [Shewanella cutis]|uniref:Uncharacterized protein n=1 Tax=Shewanella cutis TaxID=2766780 RepID=A0ABS9R0W4_9GAMM|nr:hypothetical protein [Shewanella sp. PS-2]MCG9966239.1 hypothetical protein [Shewanella sp. PS-2]